MPQRAKHDPAPGHGGGTSPSFLIAFAAMLLLGLLTVIVLPVGSFVLGAASVLMLLSALMKLNGVKWWV